MSETKVVVVFRSRLRPGVEQEIGLLGARMYELVSQLSGFISFKDFTAEDGESVSIVEFESMAAVDAWRVHPEHMQAKERGKSSFFESYSIQICHVAQAYGTVQ